MAFNDNTQAVWWRSDALMFRDYSAVISEIVWTAKRHLEGGPECDLSVTLTKTKREW